MMNTAVLGAGKEISASLQTIFKKRDMKIRERNRYFNPFRFLFLPEKRLYVLYL